MTPHKSQTSDRKHDEHAARSAHVQIPNKMPHSETPPLLLRFLSPFFHSSNLPRPMLLRRWLSFSCAALATYVLLDRGQVSVSLRPVSADSSGSTLEFVVADTGIGIPPQKCATIFEALSEGDMSTTRKFGGTGLGLAISQRLVQLMGGSICAQSELGLGSRFIFSIRVASSYNLDLPVPASPPSFAGKTIFAVVDLDPDAALLSRFLHDWGITAILTRTADEAAQQFRACNCNRNPIHALIFIPSANGFAPEALAASFQQIIGQSLPVISVQPACRLLSATAAASPHQIRLMKPLRREPLHSALDKLWEPAPADSVVASLPASAADSHATAATTPLRVLVAEDNLMNQRLIARFLEKMGHSVTLAPDGQEALNLVQEHSFRSRPHGYAHAHHGRPRGHPPDRSFESPTGHHVPILALTANAFDEDRKLCLQAGMDGFLAKRFRLPIFAPPSTTSSLPPPPSLPPNPFTNQPEAKVVP